VNEKTGRTFWDVVSENRSTTLFIAFFIVAIFGYAIYHKYKITISNFSVEPPTASTAKEIEEKIEPATPVKEGIRSKKPEYTKPAKEGNTKPEVKRENNDDYIYTGYVVDNNSNAVEGVEVEWGNQIVNTSANGAFYLKIPKSLKEPKITLSKNGKISPVIENPSGTTILFSPK